MNNLDTPCTKLSQAKASISSISDRVKVYSCNDFLIVATHKPFGGLVLRNKREISRASLPPKLIVKSSGKTVHSLSTVFEGSRYDLGDQRKVFC